MHTKDFLAQELNKAGLGEMADRAAAGYYHDFLSPLALPCQQLMIDLNDEKNKTVNTAQREAIVKLMNRHSDGEFDANDAESNDWAKSPEGQGIFRQLLR